MVPVIGNLLLFIAATALFVTTLNLQRISRR
jgi:hypothetical protein